MIGYGRHRRITNALWALPLIGEFLLAPAAAAANFEICVQSDADLASALNQVQSVAVTAKIVQHKLTAQNKAYNLHGTVWHNGIPGVRAGSELLGGYTAGCASRDIAAGNTLITDDDFNAFDGLAPYGDMTVEGLTFSVPGGIAAFLGSDIAHKIPSGSTILFRRDAFVNASYNELSFVWSQGSDNDSTIRIVDTLIANNTGPDLCGLYVAIYAGAPEFDWINNTIADNSGSNASGACFFANGTNSKLYAYNNIIYGTSGTNANDLRADTDQVVQVDNMLGSRSGPAAIFSSGNSSSDPNLDTHYVPQAPSPAINSGSNSVPGGLPAHDLDGGARIVGSTVDRGAYETTIDPHPKQTVTKHGVDDGSAGTLSNAVASVVNNGGGTIDFNIGDGGSCPWVVTETSELDVNVTATIDGYSQTGTSANDIDPGDDANLCIILQAGGGTPPARGLVVQNSVADGVSVTIKGLAFSGFATAAIDLQGGSQHSIVGNHFGGSVGGRALAPNGYDVRLGAAAHDATIGSTDVADRNIIGDATGSGIVIASGSQGNQIVGNYVGVGWSIAGSSYTNRANGSRGIYVAGNGNAISGNLIGNNAQAGIVLEGGGATGNLVSGNFIGTDAAGAALGNADRGIHFEGGAGNAPANNTVRFNTIADNGSQGVLVDIGQGNKIRKNAIYSNALLGIDLGAAGVNANDDDGGIHSPDEANRGQNFPLLTTAGGGFASGYASGTLTTTPGDYVVDLYLAAACTATYREGRVWLGSGTVTVPVPVLGYQGTANFSIPITSAAPTPGFFGGSLISATATDANGNTSEYSACASYVNDQVFANGFEPPPV